MARAAKSSWRYLIPFTPYPGSGTSEACDLCDGVEKRCVATWDRRLKRLTTVICEGCGLMRTDPMPTEEELSAYYASQYRRDYQLAGDAPPRYHRRRSARRAEARAALLAAVLAPGKRVLDVGSGGGEFLAAAKAKGCEAIGLEPGEAYAAYARKAHGVEVMATTWREAELAPESFDVISMHHVLEHLRQPVQALNKLAAALKTDGVFYISVPDVTAGSNPAYERLHFAHVHGFSPQTLRRAAFVAGLVPDERFPAHGATMIFRKRRPDDSLAAGDCPSTDEIVARMAQANPFLYIFGFGFLRRMIRRNVDTIADQFAGAPLRKPV